MTNFDTVKAIAENVQKVLRKEGIHFSKRTYDDEKNVPASLLPLGEVYYNGEVFENAYGQRPLYAEAGFTLKVLLSERDPEEMMLGQLNWAHKIRAALSVDALNSGPLAAAKYVSRVNLSKVEVENRKNTSSLIYKASIRYREI